MMMENLEAMEQALYQVKAMLKEPDYQIFDDVKAQMLNTLKLEQAKMNPTPYVKADKQQKVPAKGKAEAAAAEAPAAEAQAAQPPSQPPADDHEHHDNELIEY